MKTHYDSLQQKINELQEELTSLKGGPKKFIFETSDIWGFQGKFVVLADSRWKGVRLLKRGWTFEAHGEGLIEEESHDVRHLWNFELLTAFYKCLEELEFYADYGFSFASDGGMQVTMKFDPALQPMPFTGPAKYWQVRVKFEEVQQMAVPEPFVGYVEATPGIPLDRMAAWKKAQLGQLHEGQGPWQWKNSWKPALADLQVEGGSWNGFKYTVSIAPVSREELPKLRTWLVTFELGRETAWTIVEAFTAEEGTLKLAQREFVRSNNWLPNLGNYDTAALASKWLCEQGVWRHQLPHSVVTIAVAEL